MRNSFFDQSLDAGAIRRRVQELSTGKVGFYSVGLYPASLAYNCAMQNAKGRLLLAPRPGRDLLGAFPKRRLQRWTMSTWRPCSTWAATASEVSWLPTP